MNHRDRVMMALSHQEPDRMRVDFGSSRVTGIVAQAYERLKTHLGVNSPTRFTDSTSGRVAVDGDIMERFEFDTRRVPLQPLSERSETGALPTSLEDRWGVCWHLGRDGRFNGLRPPLVGGTDLADLHTFRWPDPNAAYDEAIAPIGDLIGVGVDIVNPIQVSAADMGATRGRKKEFGRHLSFWGAIDAQRVLPLGTPEEVRAEVRATTEDIAPGGGYVLSAVHNTQVEFAPENVCAIVEAAREFGPYTMI